MSRKPNIDKFKAVFFDDMKEQDLTPAEQEQLKRYRYTFTLQLENPATPEVVIRDMIMEEFGVSQSQAYRDLGLVRILLGNVQNAKRAWVQHIVNETLKEAIATAKAMGPKYLKHLIVAASQLAKYNRLDKEETLDIPWDEIIPASIEPTTDPSVLGIEPMENLNERIAALKKKYLDEIEINYTHFEEMKQDGNEEDLLQ